MVLPAFSRSTLVSALCGLLWLINGNLAFAQSADSLRIISVDSNATEILQALGVGQQIVAADITSEPLLAGQKVDNLGYHRALSAEALLALQPDLIVGSDHTGPPATVRAIENAGLNLIRLDSPKRIADLIDNIALLADTLDRQAAGEKLIAEIQQIKHSINNRLDDTVLKMVFLLDLNDRGLSQGGQGTVGNDLITVLNGVNASQFSGYQTVSLESILAINPDVILVGKRSNGAPPVNDLLERYPLLKHTPAGEHQRIISVDASALIAGLSINAVTQAQHLAEKIYSATP